MLNKIKNNKGFTIIEVMIVLAIAGLIILVVLLAVPALQRNARNTAIKNDASAVASAVSDYESNNDGTLPAAVVQAAGSGTFDMCDASPCGGTVAKATGKVQPNTTVNFETATSSTTTATSGKYDIGTIDVVFKAKCGTWDGTNQGVTYSPRATAVVYMIETSSSKVGKCIDS